MFRTPHPLIRHLRLALAFAFTFACDPVDGTLTAPTPDGDGPVMVQPQVAHAELEALETAGHEVSGTVVFSPQDDGLAVTGWIDGFAPHATHALHIHETGDCSASDGSSAGGHFAPRGHDHGGPDKAERHLGDLGNVTFDGEGRAALDARIPEGRLDGPLGVVGRAVVMHIGADDETTQPAGDAGTRIACAVIHSGAG